MTGAPEGGQPGPDRAGQVRGYVADVRAALTDLSPDVVDELLDGLEADLLEQSAESTAPLRDVLGPPALLAAELRESAGMPVPSAPGAGGWIGPLGVVAGRVAREGAGVWWVVRGLSLGAVAAYFVQSDFREPLQWAHWVEDLLLPVLVALVVVILSVVVGRRGWLDSVQPRTARWGLRSIEVLTVLVLAPAAAAGLLRGVLLPPDLVVLVNGAEPVAVPAVAPAPRPMQLGDEGVWFLGEPVVNLFAYGPDGSPLEGVRLVDDRGRLIQLGPGGFIADRPDMPGARVFYHPGPDPALPFGVFPLSEILVPASGGLAPGEVPTPAPLPRESVVPLSGAGAP